MIIKTFSTWINSNNIIIEALFFLVMFVNGYLLIDVTTQKHPHVWVIIVSMQNKKVMLHLFSWLHSCNFHLHPQHFINFVILDQKQVAAFNLKDVHTRTIWYICCLCAYHFCSFKYNSYPILKFKRINRWWWKV